MSVQVTLHCDGCNAGPIKAGRVAREFVGSHGDWGLGIWRTHLPPEPADWMMFDPYTQCTYCPVCSEELFGPPVNQDALAEIPASFDHYALA